MTNFDAEFKDREYENKPYGEMSRSDVLEAVARRYDVYSDDQIACKRFGGKKHQNECDMRAELYHSVSEELRAIRDMLYRDGY